ncbi:MAG: S49 family peptidase [Anaerolineae bacterium]|jgi:protease-4
MQRANRFSSYIKALGLVLLVVVLPLAAGYALSLYVYPAPKIAIIPIEGDIWSFTSVYISQALAEARDDPAVHAVVLEIASPGGEVTASENLYYDVLKLREQKPVIASIDELAASGAYYVASAADQIYAKPSSAVGNIGVISLLPEPDYLDEELYTTGPFKLSGGPQESYIRQLEMLKETFLAAILAQRSDRLSTTPETLSRGEIYLGLQAQQMGLVDETGSREDAIAAAAEMAKLRRFETVDWVVEVPEWEATDEEAALHPRTATALALPPEQLPPGLYYRYLEPSQ